MKIICRLFVTLMLLVFVAACGEKSISSSAGILNEISGVWRAKGESTMMSIIYSEKKVRLLIGDDAVSVTLGEVDNVNKTANMNVTLRNGKQGIWTIRQIWDKEKTSFHLQLTLHDGTQDEFAFVRKISTDDLNKIANAEALTHSGSIGDAAMAAEAAAAPATSPVQAQPESAAAPTSPVVAPAAEPAAIAPNVPAPMTWAPSFDCTKASTGPERLVCSNRELSEADVKLAHAYKAAANVSADKESLRNAQSAWRKDERDTCSNIQCMLTAYEDRLAQLPAKE